MRFAFLCLIVFACGTVYGGEEVSVLAPSAPTPAAVVTTSCSGGCCNGVCNAGHARVRTRYRVVNEGCDACTGRPVRSVTRGVVRGTGAVVQGVGGVALDVITFPARVCRNGRCN